jgi:hypothetical protein
MSAHTPGPKTLLALSLAATLAGCATVSPGTIATEATWQALNVVDTGQTVTIARNPERFQEAEGVTRALTGAHPSTGRVYAVMGAYAVLHAGVTLAIEEENPGHGPWAVASVLWQALTLGEKTRCVVDNFHYGIDPWLGTRGTP